MKAIYYLIILCVVISCCKEPIIPENSIIGDWSIVQVDSLVYRVTHDFFLIQSFADTCTIHFYSDSMGRFNHPVRALSGSEVDFRWTYDSTSNRMDLDFANGATNGLVKRNLTDTIKLYVRDYLNPPRITLTRYYCLHLIKHK